MKFSLRRQSTGWVYRYMSQLVPFSFRVFFKKIYLNKIPRISSSHPVLLASNHPTAFLDPCLFGAFVEPPVYFMTRGDVFKKPFFRKLMESVNMFPVYRFRDGYNSRDRNDEVFEYVADKLRNRRVVCIFVEGEHHLDKRVLPPQKGLARMAFQTYEQHKLEDLQVVPVGCNYHNGAVGRDIAFINVGEPFFVRELWDDYLQNPASAIRKFNEKVENALKALCYHIEDKNDDDLAEQLLTLVRNAHLEPDYPTVVRNSNRFDLEKSVCDRVNALSSEEKDTLKSMADQYFIKLADLNIADAALVQPRNGNWWWLGHFLFSFPFWLAGKIGALPVTLATARITAKKVKKAEFRTSVLFGAGNVLGIPYFGLLAIAGLCTFNPYWIGFSLSLPLLAWFSLLYEERLISWRAARKATAHPERNMLLGMRRAIMENAGLK